MNFCKCGKQKSFYANNCWVCHKNKIQTADKFCIDCGKQLWKYSKNIKRCAGCKNKLISQSAKKWKCIDCNSPVNRKVKRCNKCDKIARQRWLSQPRSNETKQRMSKAFKGRKCYWFKDKKRPEHGKIMSEWWTPERKEKARKNMIERCKNPEYLKKLSEYSSGKNNPNWKNGLSQIPYTQGFYKSLKQTIRKRDNFTCNLCNISENKYGKSLSIHHIDYSKDNHNPINLISLCVKCNSFVNFNREKWQLHFSSLLYNSDKT